MPRIIVQPDQLELLGGHFKAVSGQLWELERRLWAVMRSMDWEARQRAGVEEQVSAAGMRAATLASDAEALGRFLSLKAQMFAEADRTGADSVGGMQGWYQGALNGALVAARHTWRQAQQRGDDEMAGAAQQQADRLRSLGATVTDDDLSRIDQPYNPDTEPPLPRYDGRVPAPGTTLENAARPVSAPVIGLPGSRTRATYDEVIDQFAVAANPRYIPRDSSGDGQIDTFCNIFVWDVTRAMGAEIPHWVSAGGEPSLAGSPGSWELDANATADWLREHGGRFGWYELSAEAAQAWANQGNPVVAAWHSGSGEAGHVAIVRPGAYDSGQGPVIAQAGGRNLNRATAGAGFGAGRLAGVKYYAHE